MDMLRIARSFLVSLVLGGSLLASPRVMANASEPRFEVVDVGDGTLAFVRRRAHGQGKEGVVVDAHRLVDDLKARVLEARGLSEVADLSATGDVRRRNGRYGMGDSRQAGAREASPYVFSHKFAVPFQYLEASLRLRPLADPEEGAFVFPLSVVLALSIVFGLLALYRMAATQVRFAERRNNFVSAVSHELKTPLTAIRMHSEMLEEDLVESEAKRREYYATITRESERLTRLIENVLAFSQIERKTRKLELRVGDISATVRDSLSVLGPHAKTRGFDIEFDAQGPLPHVCFEPDAVRQILFNLVDNALKYARETSDHRITVCCRAEDAGVVLSVRDRGPGVRREHLKSVFEPFFRGENELTRRTQGTGIGLSLVKGLAHSMGAQVRGVNADPGFEVCLLLPKSCARVP